MSNYDYYVKIRVYSPYSDLESIFLDVFRTANFKYPGIHKTHEISSINGHSGLPHGDYGFQLEVELSFNSKLKNNEETLKFRA